MTTATMPSIGTPNIKLPSKKAALRAAFVIGAALLVGKCWGDWDMRTGMEPTKPNTVATPVNAPALAQ